ncbi:unnamed protein product [Auanema sp. JU1783]|nr:unnamed protein product [Auanema sp. JU1783]
MGGTSSMYQQHPQELNMMDQHSLVDIRSIVNGIPKMMQVADDMHRMTDYIMDLRNMTLGLVAISLIGVIGFLILRAVNGRTGRSRRKRSILRQVEEGYPPMPRYYYQSQYAPEPWDRPKSTFSHHSQMDEKKPVDSRSSPENNKINGALPYKSFTNEEAISPDLDKKMMTTSLPSDTNGGGYRHTTSSTTPQKV